MGGFLHEMREVGKAIIKIVKSDINSGHGDFPSTRELETGGLL